MQSLNIFITALLLLFSMLFTFQSEKVIEHKIYCPEDMYGQEYLKFYNMTAFLTTWTTSSPNQSITIPTTGGGYLYDVAWGDGTTSVNQTGNASHVYSAPGDYQISITGSFPRIYFNNTGDKNKIKSIDQWGIQPWISMENAFWGCHNLEGFASDTPTLSNVLSCVNMFRDSDFNQNIGNWDVSSVTDMSGMFSEGIFNQDIGSWDVSSVINMHRMFSIGPFNQDISSWDVSSVTDMSFMFRGCLFNQAIGNWDVSNVTTMERMFEASNNFNQNLNSWNVSNVTNMHRMFDNNNSFNGAIGNWDVSNVTNMRFMFCESQFNRDIGNWDVSSVTNMERMFFASPFNRDIGNWDVSSVTDMRHMFDMSQFNQDIGNWDVSSVISMIFMFHNASQFNQDISSWDVSNAPNMLNMFDTAISFDQNLGNWNVSNGPNMSNMFVNAGLSTQNYDLTLISWALQSPSATNFSAGNSRYCLGADARNMLVNTYGWNINDGGEEAPFSIDNIFTNDNGNNLWEDAANWSLMSVPTAIHDVIIPLGMTCIVTDWTSLFEDGLCYTIEVEDGAVFEVMDGAIFRTAVPCNY